MKHSIKPKISNVKVTPEPHPSNFADSKNRRFLIKSQEDLNAAPGKIRRKQGVDELLKRMKNMAAVRGFDASMLLFRSTPKK